MSESFKSARFNKIVWLTNHAIESMSKRRVTLDEVKQLIELGEYTEQENGHGWMYYTFPKRQDNLVCAAMIKEKAIIIKTIMIQWKLRE